jgi:pimeloyl-ACP methyl ester carboxylesterase
MTRRVDLPEITLAVTEAGPADGPPVLLLHGFPDRATLWRAQIPALADAGYRVVAPDLRGFGDSDRPDGVEHYGMRHLVGDVVALLDALGIGRTALAGHDWGAGLGWSLTMVTDRISRYAAFSVGHPGVVTGIEQKEKSWYMLWFQFPGVAEDALPADDWAFLRRWAHPEAAADDPLVARQIDDLSRPGALTAALNWYRANIGPASFGRTRLRETSSVTCPVLGVWSSGDRFLTEEQMTGTASRVTGGFRYERLDDTPHWIPEQAPERTTALLLEFLG